MRQISDVWVTTKNTNFSELTVKTATQNQSLHFPGEKYAGYCQISIMDAFGESS